MALSVRKSIVATTIANTCATQEIETIGRTKLLLDTVNQELRQLSSRRTTRMRRDYLKFAKGRLEYLGVQTDQTPEQALIDEFGMGDWVLATPLKCEDNISQRPGPSDGAGPANDTPLSTPFAERPSPAIMRAGARQELEMEAQYRLAKAEDAKLAAEQDGRHKGTQIWALKRTIIDCQESMVQSEEMITALNIKLADAYAKGFLGSPTKQAIFVKQNSAKPGTNEVEEYAPHLHIKKETVSPFKRKRSLVHVLPAGRHSNYSLEINRKHSPPPADNKVKKQAEETTILLPKSEPPTHINGSKRKSVSHHSSSAPSSSEDDSYHTRKSQGSRSEGARSNSSSESEFVKVEHKKRSKRELGILRALRKEQLKNIKLFTGTFKNGATGDWDEHVENVKKGCDYHEGRSKPSFLADVLIGTLRDGASSYYDLRAEKNFIGCKLEELQIIMATSPWGDVRTEPVKINDVLDRHQGTNEDTLDFLHSHIKNVMKLDPSIPGYVLTTFLMRGLNQKAYDHLQRNNHQAHQDAMYSNPHQFLALASRTIGEELRSTTRRPNNQTSGPHKEPKAKYNGQSYSAHTPQAKVARKENGDKCPDCNVYGHKPNTTACPKMQAFKGNTK
jgi:hypothetical protein